MEQFEEFEREIAGHGLHIVAYKIETKFVCMVSNIDPGATICRVSASSREAALRSAMAEASARLAKTFVKDTTAMEPTATGNLIGLEYHGEPSGFFSVADFLALDPGERARYILSGTLSCLTSDGSTMTFTQALKQLRQASVA